MITIANIRTATADQLDDIIERTEYAEKGVAIGEGPGHWRPHRPRLRRFERTRYTRLCRRADRQ